MSTDFAPNVAVFCDFENVAIGVRDARYDKFDIDLVLERILDKGKVVFKKAYADWDRFKTAKRPMHEAAFELVERFVDLFAVGARRGQALAHDRAGDQPVHTLRDARARAEVGRVRQGRGPAPALVGGCPL